MTREDEEILKKAMAIRSFDYYALEALRNQAHSAEAKGKIETRMFNLYLADERISGMD